MLRSKKDLLSGVEGILASIIVAPNTVCYETGQGTFLRFHRTDLMFIPKNKAEVELDAGGFLTPTTRSRMNQFLPEGLHVAHNWNVYSTTEGKGGQVLAVLGDLSRGKVRAPLPVFPVLIRGTFGEHNNGEHAKGK